MQKHKILQKLQTLYANAGTVLTSAEQKQLEDIDRTKREIMLGAERRCRKFKFGTVAFSPHVNKAKKLVELWTMIKDQCEGKRRSTTTIR